MAACELEDFLGMGVVGSAERIRFRPVKEAEVVDEVSVVVSLASDRGVLVVLAEAREVERFAVDEELLALDADRADPDGQFVGACSRLHELFPATAHPGTITLADIK